MSNDVGMEASNKRRICNRTKTEINAVWFGVQFVALFLSRHDDETRPHAATTEQSQSNVRIHTTKTAIVREREVFKKASSGFHSSCFILSRQAKP
jgi:hypothetical protein